SRGQRRELALCSDHLRMLVRVLDPQFVQISLCCPDRRVLLGSRSRVKLFAKLAPANLRMLQVGLRVLELTAEGFDAIAVVRLVRKIADPLFLELDQLLLCSLKRLLVLGNLPIEENLCVRDLFAGRTQIGIYEYLRESLHNIAGPNRVGIAVAD